MDKLKKAFNHQDRTSVCFASEGIGRIHMAKRYFFWKGLIVVFITMVMMACSSGAPASTAEVDKLYDRYREGNKKALLNLIDLYEDDAAPKSIRMQALKSVINSNDPNGFAALRKSIETGSLEDREMFILAVRGLADGSGQKNVGSVVKALETSRQNFISDRDEMMRVIEEQVDDRSIANILSLYAHEEEDYRSFEAAMTRILGKMNDARVVPILMAIASDKRVPLNVRNSAIKILGQKNDPAIGKLLAELIHDPNSQNQIRDFALASTNDLKDGRVILALVEALHSQQASYFTTVDAITSALKNYNDPSIKPVLLAVITDDTYPIRIRRQALEGMANYVDPVIAESLIEMLNKPENFIFYAGIKGIVDATQSPELSNKLQRTALAAQQNAEVE